jgi:hypothetical protein
MGRTFDRITPEVGSFLEAQPVFFVATAPSAPDGYVNCSPKGLSTLVVLDPTTVAYLDLTGSGSETIAHLRQNGRIILMFCAFDGKPNIVRLYGRGVVLDLSSPDATAIAERLRPLPGARSVIRVHVTRVSTSCGYAVPRMRYEGDRPDLLRWADRKGEDGLEAYRAEHNAQSIDGLPALESM